MDTRRPRSLRFDARALGADVRRSWSNGLASLALTLVFTVILVYRMETGASPTVELMPDLDHFAAYWPNVLCQAFGWTGLIWSWLSIALGLLRSSTRSGWFTASARTVERWHRTLSLTTIALMLLHILMFLVLIFLDRRAELGSLRSFGTAFAFSFVPGAYSEATGELAILIGIIALYLAAVLGMAFYSRRLLGPVVWRFVHASIVVVYILSVWHTLLYGTNVWYAGLLRSGVWLGQLPLLGLLLARLFSPRSTPGRAFWFTVLRAAAALAAVATTAVTAWMVVSRDGGGRIRGEATGTGPVTPEMIWLGTGVFIVLVALGVIYSRHVQKRRRPASRGRVARDRSEARR